MAPNEYDGRKSQNRFQDLVVEEEFKLATLNINQIMGNDKGRQRSESIVKPQNKEKGNVLNRIQPIADKLTATKIYHYAHLDTFHASIVTRNVEAPPSWFT